MGKGISRLGLHWLVTEERAPSSVNSPAPGSPHHESWAIPHGQGREVGTLHMSGNPVWLGHKVGDEEEERALQGILKEMKKEDWPQTFFPSWTVGSSACSSKKGGKGWELKASGRRALITSGKEESREEEPQSPETRVPSGT